MIAQRHDGRFVDPLWSARRDAAHISTKTQHTHQSLVCCLFEIRFPFEFSWLFRVSFKFSKEMWFLICKLCCQSKSEIEKSKSKWRFQFPTRDEEILLRWWMALWNVVEKFQCREDGDRRTRNKSIRLCTYQRQKNEQQDFDEKDGPHFRHLVTSIGCRSTDDGPSNMSHGRLCSAL